MLLNQEEFDRKYEIDRRDIAKSKEGDLFLIKGWSKKFRRRVGSFLWNKNPVYSKSYALLECNDEYGRYGEYYYDEIIPIRKKAP